MQFLFVLSGSLICIVLIVITKFQLDWLRRKIVQTSEKVIENQVIYDMRALSRVQSKFVASEVDYFVKQVASLHYQDTLINGLIYNTSNPWVDGEVKNSKTSSSKLNYSGGAYYSRNELSSLGIEKVSNESRLNLFYPFFYSTLITGFFQGYQLDEIFYFYPEVQRKTEYTPLNAEWYYIAANTSQNFSITEPYNNGEDSWVTAFSKAVVLDEQVIAVVALNGSLDYIVSRVNELTILDSGFFIIVAKEGVVLNVPVTWRFSTISTYPRIFDESFSGISENQWNRIKNTEDGSQHQFTDAQGLEYEMVKQGVYSEHLGLTHYLLACALKEDLQDYSKDTNQDFSFVYRGLFWAILSCGLFALCLASVLIFLVARTHTIQLGLILGVFNNVLKKVTSFGENSRTNSEKLQAFSEDFSTLLEACKVRLNKLEEVESGYVSHAWDYKKPGDVFLYQSWEGSTYPYNYYTGGNIKWRNAISHLLKIS